MSHLFFNLLIYILAVLGSHYRVQAFSSCSERGLLSSCSAQVSHCSGFSCFGTWALECGLSSCSAWAYMPCSMRHLPRPGIKPMVPICRRILNHWTTSKVPAISKDTLLHRNCSLPSCLVVDKLRNIKVITRTSRLGVSWETPKERPEGERLGRQTPCQENRQGPGGPGPCFPPHEPSQESQTPCSEGSGSAEANTLTLY